ncbi:MAG: DNA primase [Candidatus Omnitrophica bacterium]|nr:DNA primase [Candidatus Omnitrophota bacterium]MDD5552979.1 DNA primase [Candidatus Omnitrophota bacterium]
MAGRIPENILEDILSRVDIVELISAYIPLKRAGRNFRACCPFHHEKTPSFMVSPDRQIFHCFGCDAGGNAFGFLMQYERLEFPEAVETLARKAGVTLPRDERKDPSSSSLAALLLKINEAAASYYVSCLDSPGGLPAKKYLLKRGLNEETIKTFRIGYAPKGWETLTNHLRNKGFNLSLLEKAGLVLSKEGGGYYDRFRDRIIFPIFDIKTRVIAFGARILPDAAEAAQKQAKYVNSPETPVYVKGRNLYGLNFSKEAVRENDAVAVVEGYLDFIMPYQAGLKNIIASCGTAFTIEQARLIKRYTSNVVMVYDADNAGQMAALRNLDIFIEEGMDVKVVSLPEGLDPDLFVRKNGFAAFKERIDRAENIFDYKLKILKARHGAKSIESKAAISSEILLTINRLKNAILKTEYIKRLAQELDLREDALLQELSKMKQATPGDTYNPPVKRAPEMNPTERLLIKLMLEEEGLIDDMMRKLSPEDFLDERASRVVSIMFELNGQGKNIETNKLINRIDDETVSRFIRESALLPEVSEQNKDIIIDDCVRRLKNDRLKAKKQELHERIKAAQLSQDEDKLQRLMREFHCLIKER